MQHRECQPGQVRELLVVTNESFARDAMLDAVRRLVAPGARVHVVSPALVSWARLWTSDLTAGRIAARNRLYASLSAMRLEGLDADGVVGDPDPVQAIEDALCVFPAEHVLVCLHAPNQRPRAERHLLERGAARCPLPLSLSHVIVDLEADARIAAAAA